MSCFANGPFVKNKIEVEISYFAFQKHNLYSSKLVTAKEP